jgi:transketolase C-terminal domain/subunit
VHHSIAVSIGSMVCEVNRTKRARKINMVIEPIAFASFSDKVPKKLRVRYALDHAKTYQTYRE